MNFNEDLKKNYCRVCERSTQIRIENLINGLITPWHEKKVQNWIWIPALFRMRERSVVRDCSNFTLRLGLAPVVRERRVYIVKGQTLTYFALFKLSRFWTSCGLLYNKKSNSEPLQLKIRNPTLQTCSAFKRCMPATSSCNEHSEHLRHRARSNTGKYTCETRRAFHSEMTLVAIGNG